MLFQQRAFLLFLVMLLVTTFGAFGIIRNHPPHGHPHRSNYENPGEQTKNIFLNNFCADTYGSNIICNDEVVQKNFS
jgi:hypothetical protein